MTSPAQLKYLDAIGIPVWVSRDKIIELVSNHEPEAHASGSDALEKLMHDLDQAPTRTTKPAPDAITSVAREKTPTNQTSPTPPVTQHANEIARTAHHIVYGRGSLQADWVVVGVSPELNDEHTQQPYAGESGVLLNNMLKAVGLENPQQQAYVIHVVNSAMQIADMKDKTLSKALNTALMEKLGEIQAKVVLIVGQLAAQNLLQCEEPLARLRNKSHQLGELESKAIVTYYPSHLLSKPLDKRKAWEDLKLAMQTLQ